MKVATALVAGQRPEAELAQAAVEAALAAAGLARADNVILLLTHDFCRHAQPAVLAAARAAGCLSVSGSTASGLFTERGWQLDQPAAAALVYSAQTSDVPAESPLLSFSGHGRLPFDWQDGTERIGMLDTDAATWSHGRTAENGCAEFHLPGVNARLVRSSGLRLLGEPLPVEQCAGYELRRVGGHSAVDSLRRALPAELRERPPLHHIVALRQPDAPGIALLSANADGSLTLAESLSDGETIIWAIRQPLAAEQEMREALTATVNPKKRPNFALMFSCIGRGPLFYGNDDRDLVAFRDTFPDTPLLGAYGTGQIAPLAGHNRLFHNTALTLLFESAHV
ncbi:FIST C-terminal domain-containing protein [Ferribacterium limneticum]|uniref:FIST C-terminal domain-containing protein n=1 Tax=Ferribacterium limneticum TaxID=76259 RepID=UPI001CF854A4|nr:FIST C-terminal domain-containing protein [Ferribacterium limneticum]UCV24134.1 FIST C-terminal domain-containing protein [Ferribacterium limneticum]